MTDPHATEAVVVGLGSFGRSVAAALATGPDTRLAAVVEINPARARALAESSAAAVPVVSDVAELPRADVAVLCTGNRFDRVAPTVRALLARRTGVILTGGESGWPWLRHPHLADVLSNEARRAGVPVLGLGAHPSLVCVLLDGLRGDDAVTALRVVRTLDYTAVSEAYRKKAGIGRSAEQFRRLATERLVGIAGTAETVVLLAQALGRHPTRAEIATTYRPSFGGNDADHGTVARVAAVRQTAAYSGVDLELRFDVRLDATCDASEDDVEIVRAATSRSRHAIDDGVGLVTTAVAAVQGLSPGLLTLLDWPTRPTKAPRAT